jgi:hypothetical protein
MSQNLELFESASITIDDVKLWLRCVVPHISTQRQDYYVKHCDVANKIFLLKKEGSFKKLITIPPEIPCIFSTFKTKYKCDPAEPIPKCSRIKCYCNLKSCKLNQFIKRRSRNRRYYVKKIKLISNSTVKQS